MYQFIFFLTATSREDFTEIMNLLTVSSNQPTCTNITIMNDDILEGCEAFFVAFEVDPNFSGVATVPRDEDKSIIIIVDDLIDGNNYNHDVVKLAMINLFSHGLVRIQSKAGVYM